MSDETLIAVLPWVIGGGVLVVMALVALAFTDRSGGREMRRRVARVSAEAGGGAKRAQPLLLDRQDSGIPTLDRLIKTSIPNPQRIRARLERTGRRIALGEYLLANLALGAVVWVTLGTILGLPAPLALAVGVMVGVGAPHLVVKTLGDRRVALFIASFPDAIDLICRGLRAGLPVGESINAVGREMPDPLGGEFRRIGDGVRLGASLDTALWEVARRIDAPEFRFLVIAMAIQRETGGNLAETLGNLAELLRRRRQMKLKVRALSSEARASAVIIGALPFLVFTGIWFMNPEYLQVFFTDPRAMRLGAIAVAMLATGIAVMARMARFEI